jgi:methylmalonyl-CoA mutase
VALACLCSQDNIYAEHAIAAAKALKAAGAKHIYLAGRPGEQEAAFRSVGVEDFVFAGMDAVALLQELYRLTE